MSDRIDLAGHEFSKHGLLRRVMQNMQPTICEGYGVERWVKVMRVFGFGSTVATAMCREFGFDPEERVRK